jgi:hypothetical protein
LDVRVTNQVIARRDVGRGEVLLLRIVQGLVAFAMDVKS